MVGDGEPVPECDATTNRLRRRSTRALFQKGETGETPMLTVAKLRAIAERALDRGDTLTWRLAISALADLDRSLAILLVANAPTLIPDLVS